MSGTTIITQPEIGLVVNGKRYPCQSARIAAHIGRPSQCMVTMTTGDDKDGGFLQLSKIIQEAAKFQTSTLKDVKKANATVTIKPDYGGEIAFSGVLMGVEVNGTAAVGGGLRITANVVHKDFLLDAFTPSIYKDIALTPDDKTALSSPYSYGSNPILNIDSLKTSPGDSVAKRMLKIFEQLSQRIDGTASTSKTTAEILKNNKAAFDTVKEFLTASDKSTKLLNGNYEPTKVSNTTVDVVLFNALMQQDTFLSEMYYTSEKFRLYYSPSLIGEKSGTLRNKKYGNEGAAQSFSAPVNSINIATSYSKPWIGPVKEVTTCIKFANPKQVGTIAAFNKKENYSTAVTDAGFSCTYPAKPVRKEGQSFTINSAVVAPFLIVPPVLAEKCKVSENKSAKGGKDAEAKQVDEGISSEMATELEAMTPAAVAIAQSFYWEHLLAPLGASITTPLKGNVSGLIVGEVTEIMGNGSPIGKGVLSSIVINASTNSLTATLGFQNMIISGANVE